jgi:hypothetical protein
MAIHATLVLDSGAFFQEIQPDVEYKRLDVGFFGSGDKTTEIHVVVDGTPMRDNETKLGRGEIEVLFKKADGSVPALTATRAFSDSLLRLRELYPVDTPVIDETRFDCIFIFTAGRLCCSMVKVRPFQEWTIEPWEKTKLKRDTDKAISHNVAVHFELEKGDTLELVRNKTTVLFTTASIPSDTKRIDIDIVADNSTAVRFYKDALKLNGKTAWLPNQGDPPTIGPP